MFCWTWCQVFITHTITRLMCACSCQHKNISRRPSSTKQPYSATTWQQLNCALLWGVKQTGRSTSIICWTRFFTLRSTLLCHFYWDLTNKHQLHQNSLSLCLYLSLHLSLSITLSLSLCLNLSHLSLSLRSCIRTDVDNKISSKHLIIRLLHVSWAVSVFSASQ